MAVKLRLSRYGVRGRPFYRIVATERLGKRDGKLIEALGTYDPLATPPLAKLKEERVKRWVSVGAEMSEVLRSIIRKQIPGIVEAREEHRRKKIQERRRARKARMKGSGKGKPDAAVKKSPAKKSASSQKEAKKKSSAGK